jgi:uncharacterized repeat protein (TIGR03803 family)
MRTEPTALVRHGKVLHLFTGSPDGVYPLAGLIEVKGTLYGTTASRGAYGGGAVFDIASSGADEVLHSFGSGSDGEFPYASLIDRWGGSQP